MHIYSGAWHFIITGPNMAQVPSIITLDRWRPNGGTSQDPTAGKLRQRSTPGLS